MFARKSTEFPEFSWRSRSPFSTFTTASTTDHLEGIHSDGARSFLATGCFVQRKPLTSVLPSERDGAQRREGAQRDQGEVRLQDLSRWRRLPRICDDDPGALRNLGWSHGDGTSPAEGSLQRLIERSSPFRRVRPVASSHSRSGTACLRARPNSSLNADTVKPSGSLVSPDVIVST